MFNAIIKLSLSLNKKNNNLFSWKFSIFISLKNCKFKSILEFIPFSKIIEENSNQILDFTREVKGLPEQDKIKIIEALWSIIYSNKDADIYETNLMRRLAGLLYIDNKTMGDIKEKIKQNLKWHISLMTIVLSAN